VENENSWRGRYVRCAPASARSRRRNASSASAAADQPATTIAQKAPVSPAPSASSTTVSTSRQIGSYTCPISVNARWLRHPRVAASAASQIVMAGSVSAISRRPPVSAGSCRRSASHGAASARPPPRTVAAPPETSSASRTVPRTAAGSSSARCTATNRVTPARNPDNDSSPSSDSTA
jgi:hypothetical protein